MLCMVLLYMFRPNHQLNWLANVKGVDKPSTADPTLSRIVNATKSLLLDAYELCSDASPNCKMTYQRATILNEFYAGASGKSAAFRARKLESTLTNYFQTWAQLVVYYYRVVHEGDSHFGRTAASQRLPKDIIQTSPLQQDTMQEVIDAAKAHQEEEEEDGGDADKEQVALKHSLRKFFLALICHVVGSVNLILILTSI
jgi:hypothetical protein